MNVANFLSRAADFFPSRPAVCAGNVEINYRALNAQANRVANGLKRLGLNPGEQVGLCAPNSSEWLAVYFGVLKAGGVATTFSYSLQPDELQLLVNHAKPKFVFTTGERIDDFDRLRGVAQIKLLIGPDGDMSLSDLMDRGVDECTDVERNRADVAAVLYTGGTSGVPKGVMLSHENISTSSFNVAYSERSNENDRSVCFLPLNHVFAQIHILNATIFSCGCVELMTSYDPDGLLSLASSGRITKLYAVPTIYSRLLTIDDLREKLGRVRYCFSAAASMASEIVRQWIDQTGLTIYEGYGMTESASAVTYNHFYKHVVGSVGTTVPGIEIEIRNGEGLKLGPHVEGEVCIRGRNIMKGYLNNPEDTAGVFWDGGWFRSGDVGIVDDRGYLFIVDRLKDMIITGGENVYPREVEEVIFTIAEVQECAVVGLPDREWGERVTAFIVPKTGKNISPDNIKSFLKQRLSPFKVPKQFLIVEDLPKNSTGKILKREIRKHFNAQ